MTGILVEHRHVRDAWAVGRFEVTEPTDGFSLGHVLTVVGDRLGLVAAGEGLRLSGELEDTRYGQQLVIKTLESLGIRTPKSAHRWLERLDGVGPRIASRLHAHFGEQVLDVLNAPPGDGLPDPLCSVEGIGETVAKTIRESWAGIGSSGAIEDVRWLDSIGLTRFEANSVLTWAKHRGKPARALLEEDPYSLVEVKGFGWLRADKVARAAGAAANAPTRLETAAVYTVAQECDADTLVSLGQLVRQTAKLTGVDEALVLDAIFRVARADRVVITQDDAKTRWVHPPDLVQAERSIWRVLRGGEQGRGAGDAQAAALARAQEERRTLPEQPTCAECAFLGFACAKHGQETARAAEVTDPEAAARATPAETVSVGELHDDEPEPAWEPSGAAEPWEG